MSQSAQSYPPQGHPNVSQQQPPVVQAKFSYGPLIMTTLITTVVTLGVGFAFTHWRDKRKEDEEERKEREREERAAMMPPMPMMWPGAAGNPAPASMGPVAQTQAAQAAANGPVPGVPMSTQSELNDIVDRLDAWQQNLQAREERLGLVVQETG
ncbi:MAG: hypothetical protein KAJ42_06400 [Gemmatimonadetes bacterium]|nr:hypothetical protein [Gemmatimonadota bacterium]